VEEKAPKSDNEISQKGDLENGIVAISPTAENALDSQVQEDEIC
jgi:hypothetical protein